MEFSPLVYDVISADYDVSQSCRLSHRTALIVKLYRRKCLNFSQYHVDVVFGRSNDASIASDSASWFVPV